VPKSRGGTDEISNLQWVYYDDFVNVNTIKWNMTHEEFVGIINTISKELANANMSK
jgi:hypothetical protein